MKREEVLCVLRPHTAELRQSGVRALYLFGSAVRGESRYSSDIDLACDLDEDSAISLLDFIDVKLRIADLLQRKVDLVERVALRAGIRERVESEMVRIF